MCWSAKIKTPSVDTSQIRAVDPAPLTEEPKGVLFGGEDDPSKTEQGESTSGRKSLKIAKDNSVSNSKNGDTKAVSSKSAIRKSFTNNKR